jgi:hypothetical protein
MTTRPITENGTEMRSAAMRAELDRVLASRVFAKSPRLCALLTYICESSLEGLVDELTEQQIGIHVFGRPPGYNSAEDTIVRGTARHLRDRLAFYYQDEGKEDPLQITVPKGGYMAHFEPAPPAAESAPPVKVQAGPAVEDHGASLRWPRSAKIAVAGCALLAIVLPAAAFLLLRPKAEPPAEAAGPEILWKALFTPGRKTLIVPGDASLDAYTAWEHRYVSLADYTNQNYQHEVTVSRPPSHTDVPLSVRSVTPMADLRLVSELVRIPERLGQPQLEGWTEIYYARDLVVADTHDNNLILIGSETFNPWVTLYQPLLDFAVHWDYQTDIYTVINRAPKQGEQSRYEYDRHTPGLKAYTLVALVDNTQGHGRVLMVEGTSMGSTYGAMNFFTNDHLWRPVIAASTDKSGRLHNFEALLSNDFIRGGVSNTQLLAWHVH